MMSFRDVSGKQVQAPYLWDADVKMAKAGAHDLRKFISVLQYTMEHLVLEMDPELFLRTYEAYGDLDDDEPAAGRCYDGIWSTWVMNRNLLLVEHMDDRNSTKVQLSMPFVLALCTPSPGTTTCTTGCGGTAHH